MSFFLIFVSKQLHKKIFELLRFNHKGSFLCVFMYSRAYTNLKYNKAHIHRIFDKKLKETNNEYLVSYVNMKKYPTILFVMAKNNGNE